MDQILGTILGAGLGLIGSAAIDATAQHRRQKKKTKPRSKSETKTKTPKSKLDSSSQSAATPVFHQNLFSNSTGAQLVATSSEDFGKTCERLINIACQTGQNFPAMMSTCADIDNYLRGELAKHYPNECFHIIIGQNSAFGFAVNEAGHFAAIDQGLYRIVIFTTKKTSQQKTDTHNANSGIIINWNTDK